MDQALTPQDQAFRDEVRAFIDGALTDDLREAGRLTAGAFSEFNAGHRWHQILHGRGWSAPSWPAEHGGPGWSETERYIFDSECARAGAPLLLPMGTRMVGPVLMRFGTDEQKAHYLPRILSAEHVWCQGYSEPGSGSDLASLQCRAVRDGNDYVVNGTKLWTTYAQHANRMFCLVRTSTEGKPQEGISFILIDMATPGITVEPVITLAGDHEVNQVFFDDVRVPVANRVGEENQGWTIAKYLLEFERGGDTYSPGLHAAIALLRHVARAEPAGDGGRLADDAGFALRIAEAEADAIALEFTEKRAMSEMAQGGQPGAASSLLKLRWSEVLQRVAELTVEAIGYYAAPVQREARVAGSNAEPIGPDYGVTLMPTHLNHRAATIYAGSSEIQRSIIAKLVLGL